jgi:hypothetical protein
MIAPEVRQILRSSFVRAIGPVRQSVVEDALRPERIDHVWITIEPQSRLKMRLAINTLSMKNRAAGFDPRIRVGRVRDAWLELPAPTLEPCLAFSYAEIEARYNVFFETFERIELENRLLDLAQVCLTLEVWGTPYHREGGHLCGLHQIHSQAPSCAVAEGKTGRDGALRFYLPEGERLLLLFKFCGQV